MTVVEQNPHLRTPLRIHSSTGEVVPDQLVVYAVHGRGQTTDYMMDVIRRVDIEGVSFVMPSAHENTWYPARFTDPLDDNQPALDNALDAVGTHLRWIENTGAPIDKVILLGFSQGACLLSEFLLRAHRPVAGAALLTGGYIGPETRRPVDADAAMSGLPVLLCTSTRDEWIPLSRALATVETFVGLGADTELHVYNDPEHHVSDAVVDHVRALILRLKTKTQTPQSN